MSALLDGKSLATLRELGLSERVSALKIRNGDQTPILATILVQRQSSRPAASERPL
ncbi:hypothetical protein [Paraburkholderia kururiensis]|uniref:hypothetical protein n=1 Tax=Paraburkholderia kururiensis TaxID=984307 RepID=UPI0018F2F9C1|nr:hypothetical protein [Paraburkholderia kururiensis]